MRGTSPDDERTGEARAQRTEGPRRSGEPALEPPVEARREAARSLVVQVVPVAKVPVCQLRERAVIPVLEGAGIVPLETPQELRHRPLPVRGQGRPVAR